jgi:hypothetical protein
MPRDGGQPLQLWIEISAEVLTNTSEICIMRQLLIIV